jgi:ABC-type uncharacterized transport system permease subunit
VAEELMEGILAAGLLATTPILLAALGGAVNRQAGIVNLGLDGMMLAGAFVAVLVDWRTRSPGLACLAAAAAGAGLGFCFALPITRLGTNEIVAGLGLAVLMPGLFGYLLPVFFNQASTLEPAGIPGVPLWGWEDPITYWSWLAVPLTWLFLHRTVLGLRLRAAGHNPAVALAAGLRLAPLRELATAIAGMLAGLGGAQLALVSVQLFNKDMTAGRGFVALAAFYFGDSRPVPTAVASLVFGIANAVSIRLKTAGLPDQVPEMIPYLAVIAALVAVAARGRRLGAA